MLWAMYHSLFTRYLWLSMFSHFQGCEEVSMPLMSSPTSSNASSVNCVPRHRVNFMETVGETDDETGTLLPAPPATFSDPPSASRNAVTNPATFNDPTSASRNAASNLNPAKGFVVGQQLLRVNAPPAGHHAGIRELESSVSCSSLLQFSFS